MMLGFSHHPHDCRASSTVTRPPPSQQHIQASLSPPESPGLLYSTSEEWNFFSCTGSRHLTQEPPSSPQTNGRQPPPPAPQAWRGCAGPRALGKWKLSSVLPRDAGGGAVCMQRAHQCSVECQLRSSSQWQPVHKNL